AMSVAAELAVIRPKEILIADGVETTDVLDNSISARITRVDPWSFESGRARESLLEQFRVATLAGFNLDQSPSAVAAAGAIVSYLRATQPGDLTHVRQIE